MRRTRNKDTETFLPLDASTNSNNNSNHHCVAPQKFKIDKLRPKELKTFVKSPQEIHELRLETAQMFSNIANEFAIDDKRESKNEISDQFVIDFFQKINFGNNMEKAIFNFSIKVLSSKGLVPYWNNVQFQLFYINEREKTMEELKITNYFILNPVLRKELKPHEIPFMTTFERNPKLWSTFVAAENKKEASMFDVPVESITDRYYCRRCNQNKTTYFQLQVRSADEPMTTFITCTVCNNRWKE